MNTSEAINELAAALSKAQGDNDIVAEAALCRQLSVMFQPPKHWYGLSVTQRFFDCIAFGLSDCWFWRGALHHLGYGTFSALGETKAHRVAWRIFHGDIPTGLSVLHRCDIRPCVNPEHLFLGTQQDNVADMVQKGRMNHPPKLGEANGGAKLTAKDVIEMRRIRSEQGSSYREIAKLFGVTTMTAQRAIVGTSWRHL